MKFQDVTVLLKTMPITERIAFSRRATSSIKTYFCLTVMIIPSIVSSALVGKAIGYELGNPILFVILAVASTSALMSIAVTLLRFRLLAKYATAVSPSNLPEHSEVGE
jgi:nitrate reductase NapE component